MLSVTDVIADSDRLGAGWQSSPPRPINRSANKRYAVKCRLTSSLIPFFPSLCQTTFYDLIFLLGSSIFPNVYVLSAAMTGLGHCVHHFHPRRLRILTRHVTFS